MKVILNPHAGRARAGRQEAEIRAALDAAGIHYALSATTRRGQARQEAMAAARRGETIVAAGGDGTINQVVNGLIQASGQHPTLPLGILPLGTGNDFATMAGLPMSLPAAARVIAAGRTRSVDAGWVTYVDSADAGMAPSLWRGAYFINNCAVAMEPLITLESDRITRVRGNARYLLAVIRGLARMTTWHMDVRWDGGALEGSTILLSIANLPRTGGLFLVAPEARPDDGLFDVVFAPAMPLHRVLTLLPRLLRGTHVHHPQVRTMRTARLQLSSRPATPIHVDGELITEAATTVRCQILPGRVTLLSP